MRKKIECHRKDCVSYIKNASLLPNCSILSDIDFKGRECPFYRQKQKEDKTEESR